MRYKDKVFHTFQHLAFNRYPTGWRYYLGTVLMYYYMMQLYAIHFYEKYKN